MTIYLFNNRILAIEGIDKGVYFLKYMPIDKIYNRNIISQIVILSDTPLPLMALRLFLTFKIMAPNCWQNTANRCKSLYDSNYCLCCE